MSNTTTNAPCPDCGGRGRNDDYVCPTCNGSGQAEQLESPDKEENK